ncbi:MAG: response regulator [Candidatus Eremiobacteraeota bacterium]|nr:response regulator [Candidatus Eremiobacteraeota bacterium]
MSTKQVLIVDDGIRRFHLKQALEREGFSVTCASDGAAALSKIAASRPDVVVSEIIMSPMDGYELCRQIKSNPATATLPVILMSEFGEISDPRWRQFSAGDAYSVKSAGPSKLVELIHRLLS